LNELIKEDRLAGCVQKGDDFVEMLVPAYKEMTYHLSLEYTATLLRRE